MEEEAFLAAQRLESSLHGLRLPVSHSTCRQKAQAEAVRVHLRVHTKLAEPSSSLGSALAHQAPCDMASTWYPLQTTGNAESLQQLMSLDCTDSPVGALVQQDDSYSPQLINLINPPMRFADTKAARAHVTIAAPLCSRAASS